MIDETTDGILEHLIVYDVYSSNDGKGPRVTRFVELVVFQDGIT